MPTFRVACEPTIAAASASAVYARRTVASSASCAVRHERTEPQPAAGAGPDARAAHRRGGSRRGCPGTRHLPWREPTTRSVPPATTRAPAASAATTSSTDVGADVRRPGSAPVPRRRSCLELLDRRPHSMRAGRQLPDRAPRWRWRSRSRSRPGSGCTAARRDPWSPSGPASGAAMPMKPTLISGASATVWSL